MTNEQTAPANSEWEGNANLNRRDNPVECELQFYFLHINWFS